MSRLPRFVVGLDLGQAADYSALAVVECVPAAVPGAVAVDYRSAAAVADAVTGQRIGPLQPKPVTELHVRDAQRFERGLSYTKQVVRVVEGLALPPLHQHSTLVIDRTGVGRAIFDQFVAAGLRPIGVTITAGVDVVQAAWNDYHTPKRDLVAAIQAPLGEGRLKIAAGLEHRALLEAELQNFRIKVSLSGHDSYGAGEDAEWRVGAHDDLVLAVALACWYAERPVPRWGAI